MTDQVYQNIQYPLKKIVRLLANLENIDSLPAEYLSLESREEVIQEIDNFIAFWEQNGRESLKSLISDLRDKIK